MRSKFKKALKKALIKIYTEVKGIDLRLESSLKANSIKTESIFSTHLTGSNKAQFILSLKLGVQTIKLPAILRVFSLSHDLKSLVILQKNSLGAKAFVVHKVDNLTFKSKKYDSAFKSCLEFCTRVKIFATSPLLKVRTFSHFDK